MDSTKPFFFNKTVGTIADNNESLIKHHDVPDLLTTTIHDLHQENVLKTSSHMTSSNVRT